MSVINSDKSYIQVLPRKKVKRDAKIPDDWLVKLGHLVISNSSELTEQQKESFMHDLNRHAGDKSTYSLKAQLHESLIVIYAALINKNKASDQKAAFASKLLEDASECTPGFHDRANELVESFNAPRNIDDLLSIRRQEIVSQVALQMIKYYQQDTINEVHNYNRVFVFANILGYGVRPLNSKDIYTGDIPDEAIQPNLELAFEKHYTLFSTLTSLHAQLNDLVRSQGYRGRNALGYTYAEYRKFDDDFLRPFCNLTSRELFISETDNSLVPKVLDINWHNLKLALLKKLIEEQYYITSIDERLLLNAFVDDNNLFDHMPKKAIALFSTPDELIQCLALFNEWPKSKTRGLILYYLSNASLDHQLVALDKLVKIPHLCTELGYLPDAKKKFYLSQAVHDGRMDRVKNWVGLGADLNPVLGVLIGNQKAETMEWLQNDPTLRGTINQHGMMAVIPEGPNEGKRVADVLANSKKGRQWLLEDEILFCLCPEEAADKSKNEWMRQAQADKIAASKGLFPAPNPDAIKLLQYVVYGKHKEAEALLKTNPLLLLEKIKVRDYSGRKVKGKVFQAAMCAGDVEMCVMMESYFNKIQDGRRIKLAQIQEIFPDGAGRYFAKLSSFNFDSIVSQITQSTDEDIQVALKNKPSDTPICRALNQFRKDFTTLSHSEKVFNPEHLLEAFKIYDANFKNWGPGWHKRDLFLRQVIGYVQRFLPACYAQAFAQGIYGIVNENQPLQRSFDVPNSRARLFPLATDSPTGLGFDYALGSWGGRLVAHGEMGSDKLEQPGDNLFARFMTNKCLEIDNLLLRESNRPEPTSGCSIQ